MNASHYENALAELASHVHGRNAQLVRLAHLGLNEGRDPAALQADIIAAGGEPRLTDAEVARAINTALKTHVNAPTRFPRKTHNFYHVGAKNAAERIADAPNAKERNLVRELIAAGHGATSRRLMSASPVPVNVPDAPAAFLRCLFRPDELVFAGTPFLPRTRENLKTAAELARALTAGEPPPTHFAPNPFTGESALNSEGKVSFCLDSTVAHRRHALIEFDALPLPEQAAFWMGVIRERVFGVRSLVYSGGKSIHGLIELQDDGSLAKWTQQWGFLERLLCSDPDSDYHADRACKNVARLSRFPCAVRPDTGHRQTLLWLAQ